MQDIKNKVFEMLSRLSATEVRDASASLRGDLCFDSLRMVTLLIMIEDTFGIELDEGDMNPFALLDVQSVITLVSKYVSVKGDAENG